LGSVATAPMAESSTWGARLYFYSLPFTFILIYFVPTIAAMTSKSSSFQAIFILNLFFGWSGIGWLVALGWAVSPPKKDRRPAYRITSFGAVPDEARAAVSRRPA
jgi:Superinfection immunity protein